MNKFTTILLTFIMLASSLSVFAEDKVYQLPNPGFELWDGEGTDDEPTYWNAFPSANCKLIIGCNLAKAAKHSISEDVHEGATGKYSCMVFSKKVLGIVANGLITTGQIHVGSMKAADSTNYNVSLTEELDFSQAFHGRPDSIRFWAKYITTNKEGEEEFEARMSAVIHDKYDYRDPADEDAAAHVVANAEINFPMGDAKWKQYTVPFDYEHPAENSEYILLTFTTNKLPGTGSEADSLFIDDIEMLYNVRLKNINIDGEFLSDFDPEVTDYTVKTYLQPEDIKIIAEAESANASVTIDKSEDDNLIVITVTSGDQTKVYNIHFIVFASDLVYQLPNPGFELWDGDGKDDEPTYWSAFPSADCELASVLCGFAVRTKHGISTDVRKGATGQYSCKVFATSILNVIANGLITTGRVHVGSTTAADSSNYNISVSKNPDFSQAFHGRPDSIRFWAKYLTVNKDDADENEARMSAVIHDKYDYRDPADKDAAEHVVANAELNFPMGDAKWKQYTVPFNYEHPAEKSEFILLTFTTNKLPGVGSKTDSLFIDDIEMLYNVRLKNIAIDGLEIEDFNPEITEYAIKKYIGVDKLFITADAESSNASVSIMQATENKEDNNHAIITVTSGDQTKVYNIHFLDKSSIDTFDTLANVEIFPNPMQDMIYFKNISNMAKVQIYDLTGNSVLSLEGNHTDGIDVSNLSSGVYIVSVSNNTGNTVFRKLIKE